MLQVRILHNHVDNLILSTDFGYVDFAGLWIIDGASHHHFDNVSSPIATIASQDADFDSSSYSNGLDSSSIKSSIFDTDEASEVKYVDLTVSVLSMGQIFGESSSLILFMYFV